jgi:aspartyl-tRNA(Asn)/glutamyl-tRNA(Gln) amidotransferase subunit C
MALTSEEVLHIARLARIALTDEDVQRFTAQLSGILEHFAALSAVDTEGVEPTAHPLPLSNVMRADIVSPSLSQSEALANAPLTEDGYVRVRAVLE